MVVIWESLRFAISGSHLAQRLNLPSWTAPVLGGVEVVAAVLFLIPGVRRIGGYSLLVIFAIAALLHILHGQFEIGGLIVYGAAALVCLPPRESTR